MDSIELSRIESDDGDDENDNNNGHHRYFSFASFDSTNSILACYDDALRTSPDDNHRYIHKHTDDPILVSRSSSFEEDDGRPPSSVEGDYSDEELVLDSIEVSRIGDSIYANVIPRNHCNEIEMILVDETRDDTTDDLHSEVREGKVEKNSASFTEKEAAPSGEEDLVQENAIHKIDSILTKIQVESDRRKERLKILRNRRDEIFSKEKDSNCLNSSDNDGDVKEKDKKEESKMKSRQEKKIRKSSSERREMKIQRLKYDEVVRSIRVYSRMKNFAIRIQSCWRRKMAINNYEQTMEIRRKCCVIIQRVYRGNATRRNYAKTIHSVIFIQTFIRKCMKRRSYQEVLKSTIVLQGMCRRIILKEKGRKERSIIRSAVPKLQAYARKFLNRNKYQRIQSANILLQNQARRLLARKKFLICLKVIIALQKFVRAYQTRQSYLKDLKDIITIQRVYQQRRICIKIQSAVRGYLISKQFKEKRKAITNMQKIVRAHQARRTYLKDLKSIMTIQILYFRRRACVKIQALVRGFLKAKYFRENVGYMIATRTASMKIQKNVRAYQTRKKYLKDLKAITTIQRVYRKRRACIKFQSIVRSFMKVKRFKETKRSVILVQKQVRIQQATSVLTRLRHKQVLKSIQHYRKILDILNATFPNRSNVKLALSSSSGIIKERKETQIAKYDTASKKKKEKNDDHVVQQSCACNHDAMYQTFYNFWAHILLLDERDQQQKQQEIKKNSNETKGKTLGESYNNSAVQNINHEDNTSITNVEVTFEGLIDVVEDYLFQCNTGCRMVMV